MVNQKEMDAYSETKNDRPIWEKDDVPLTKEAVERTLIIPEDLRCPVCQDLFKDAVLCPEEACEMCDECARMALINEENTNNECPVCHVANVSPDDLIPSRKTRIAVQKFRNVQQPLAPVVPENDIKRSKQVEKMPSLPDIPGITVPKGNKNQMFH